MLSLNTFLKVRTKVMNKYQKRRTAVGCVALAIVFIGCAKHLNTTVPSEPALTTTTMGFNVDPEPEHEITTTPDGYVRCPECGQAVHSPDTFLTNTEMEMLARLVEGEAGGESYACKKAVASTVLNRMILSGAELVDIIYEEGQYDVAYELDTITASEDSLNAVKDVSIYGSTVPEYVTYFRADCYHSWGDQQPYIRIDNTYFSYSADVKSACEG